MARSTYTPAIGEEICKGIRMGLSLPSACKAIGIPVDTAYGWKDLYPQFAESVENAFGECERVLVEKVSNSVRTGCKVTTTKTRLGDDGQGFEEVSIVTDDGVPSAKWLLPRINPERWSERAAIAKMVEEKSRREVEARIQYLMSCVDDNCKTQIATALMATGFEVSTAIDALPSEAPSADRTVTR